MARGRKRRITTGTKHVVDDSLDKKDDACGGKHPTSGDGLCSSENGGGRGKEIVTLTGGSHNSGREAHRRNKMKDLYSMLHTFLPDLPPKIGRAEIAEEAANYIKFLEHKCRALEKKKWDCTNPYQKPPGAATSVASLEHYISRESLLAGQISKIPVSTGSALPAQQQCFTMHTSASPNIVLSVAGRDAHVSVCAPKTPGLIPATVHFFEKHGAEVLSVQVCSDMSRTMFVMHAHVSDFADSMPAEEIFKLAKKELILWLGSKHGKRPRANC